MNWIKTAEVGDPGIRLEVRILGTVGYFNSLRRSCKTHCLERRDVQPPRLRSLLTGHLTDGNDLPAILLAELERLTGERWVQEDDTTLLTLRCSAARSRASENTTLHALA